MAVIESVLQNPQSHERFAFNRFSLNDMEMVNAYVDTFKPGSCEYNFSNLFAWQNACKFSWALYQERLLIYDGISQCAFMPLGKEFSPGELVILSRKLTQEGLSPNFCLFTSEYVKKFPKIKDYYLVKKERNDSEYIYDADKLCELTGKKLHKKRNLISQFKRSYPDYKVHRLEGDFKYKALDFAKSLYIQNQTPSKTLEQEFSAMRESFDHFDRLDLEGIVLTIGNKVVAFSIFSQLPYSTYDIQFEKFSMDFKGAAQVINQETAIYLKSKCQYLNREQDLGIKGLRQAKMSYDPEKLVTPYSLIFTSQK
ncbi:MAG: DUF2156 domain-containing protein [Desulfobacteraceae bacterium]|nr:DUF2156 domain-containing protein [Desulfobacteraceae bacterium]